MQPPGSNSEGRRHRLQLAAAVGVGALVWLVVLPLVARQPAVRATIDRNEQLGIDPTAKFYTELPAMPDLYERVTSARRVAERTERP